MDAPQPVESRHRAVVRSVLPRTSGNEATAPCGVGPASVATPMRRRWSSLQLLGDQHEIEISHADSIYRLRITSLGKLILTK